MSKVDVYEKVTNRIIEMLEQGTVPWQQPWKAETAPRNLKSGHYYRGLNVWLLLSKGYTSPYWLTFKQAKDMGGKVKSGERSTFVVFWRVLKFREDNGEKVEDGSEQENEDDVKVIPYLRYYNVFNAEQVEGIEHKIPDTEANPEFNPIQEAQRIIDSMPNRPEIIHQGNAAFYKPTTDTVTLPPETQFYDETGYYSTAFHELVHSTGHKSRCNRKGVAEIAARDSETYSREELVAEMGSSFLDAQAGIIQHTEENSAAYIQSWLKALRDDKKLVVSAAGKAQKAADYILGRGSGDNQEKQASVKEETPAKNSRNVPTKRAHATRPTQPALL